jgi:hypothetical protein
MKKKLNETAMANELRGQSLYFQEPPAPTAESAETRPRKRKARETTTTTSAVVVEQTAPPVESLPEPALEIPAIEATPTLAEEYIVPSANQDQGIETIRKAVKRLGKEATFCRFTEEEKNALGDIVYTYKRSGIRTSENEVVRIAVNWLLANYRDDGQNSVLAQVLDKLNA